MNGEKYEYIPTYKCPLCGNLVSIKLRNDSKTTQEQMEAALNFFAEAEFELRKGGDAKAASAVQFPLYIAHKCEDGNVGLAAFAGYTKSL